MSKTIKRLRVFAGPNGSGKTTLFNYLTYIKAFNSYFHINPDMISKDLPIALNLNNWPIDFSYNELINYLKYSPFQSLIDFDISDLLILEDHILSLKDKTYSNSYLSAAISDYLRFKMIQSNSSFSFESVFSHESKLKELEIAKKANFKIYFYFISTSDVLINIERIKNRVKTGGHDVSEEKIKNRYERTLNNISVALKLSDRAYIFDNTSDFSNNSFHLIAEKSGDDIYLQESCSVPPWFDKYVLKRL